MGKLKNKCPASGDSIHGGYWGTANRVTVNEDGKTICPMCRKPVRTRNHPWSGCDIQQIPPHNILIS